MSNTLNDRLEHKSKHEELANRRILRFEWWLENWGFTFGFIAGVSFFVIASLIVRDEDLFNWSFKINPLLAANLGTFLGGFVGAVASLATVALVFAAYRSQKRELAETKIALEEQVRVINKQSFETTFFTLVKIFIDYSASETTLTKSEKGGKVDHIWVVDIISEISGSIKRGNFTSILNLNYPLQYDAEACNQNILNQIEDSEKEKFKKDASILLAILKHKHIDQDVGPYLKQLDYICGHILEFKDVNGGDNRGTSKLLDYLHSILSQGEVDFINQVCNSNLSNQYKSIYSFWQLSLKSAYQ